MKYIRYIIAYVLWWIDDRQRKKMLKMLQHWEKEDE